MALALRIIIEFPVIGNFFKENKFMSKKNSKNENDIIKNDNMRHLSSRVIKKICKIQ